MCGGGPGADLAGQGCGGDWVRESQPTDYQGREPLWRAGVEVRPGDGGTVEELSEVRRHARFGSFELDLRSGELRKNGTKIRLQDKPFQILEILLERPGDVVTREQLRQKLWPADTFVDFDTGLNTAINRLRQALGDSADNPRFVETLSRRGYRFIVPVSWSGAAPATEPLGVVPPPPVPVPQTEASAQRGRLVFILLLILPLVLVAVFLATRQLYQHRHPVFHQLTFRRGFVPGARFAPDGRTIVYSGAWQGESPQLFMMRSESPEARALDLGPSTLLAVSERGEMAIAVRNNVLARVPLAGGAPREITSDIRAAEWSRDGADLAVVRIASGEDLLEYPIGHVLYRTTGYISDLRLSPRGDAFAFIEHPSRQDTAGVVTVMDLSGNARALTSKWASAGGLAWTPGGNEIWFTATERGATHALHSVDLQGKARLLVRVPGSLQLHDVSAEGRLLMSRNEPRRGMAVLRRGSHEERDISWFDWSQLHDLSDDGTTVLFDEGGEGGGPSYGVYLRHLDQPGAVRLGDGVALALSPDRQWALSRVSSFRNEMALLPIGPGEPRRLPDRGVAPVLGIYMPDGKRALILGNQKAAPLRWWLLELADGSMKPVTPPVKGFRCAISPDGGQILVRMLDDNLYIVPVSGGGPRLVPGLKDLVPIRWNADGNVIVRTTASDDLPVTVLKVNLTTGKREVLREVAPHDRTGLIGVAPVLVSRDQQTVVYSYGRTISDLYLVDGLH